MKKIIIFIVIFIVVGLIALMMWNNRTISIITLDINPSVEIRLNKNEKVKSVKPLNDDAKKIITSNLKGQNLENSVRTLTDNLVKSGYAEKDIVVLVHSTGEVDQHNLEEIIRTSFNEKEINSNIIVVNNIKKEDIELAKKNNISPAKAAYINSIIEENKNIDAKALISKSVSELLETKNTGRYCDEGYNLEGDFCLKEIRRTETKDGLVCPDGYYDFDGICYEEGESTELDNMVCQDEFEMRNNMCYRSTEMDAEPVKFTCPEGEKKTRGEMGLTGMDAGDANYAVCIDTSKATHPVTPCELPADDPTERTFVGGRCYWHRAPVIESGCPGKVQVDGMCWDDASNILICAGYRDGKQYSSRDEFCENSIRYLDPIVTEYRCEEGFKLKGNKCEREDTMEPMHERICSSGFTLTSTGRCVNYNNQVSKVSGAVCDVENSKIIGNTCIIYDIVEAKHN